MSYLIILNLGKGDWLHGFPKTIAQLWDDRHPSPMQFTGSLPPMPDLASLYQEWQTMYTALYSNLGWRQGLRHPGFEVDETDITHISQAEFDRLCERLRSCLNTWLSDHAFQNIDRQLRTHLNPSDTIRLIIVADDARLLQLPWSLWEFLEDYPQAEVALSLPEYARSLKLATNQAKRRVKILAILGNSEGIQVTHDQQVLQQLPQAEVKFLVEPTSQELNQQLWQPGWDILFFAGHSSSVSKGMIQLNQTERLTIDQLKYALRTAIAQGLKLAIFNSCDGLGLAQDLADLQIPQVIVMREPVPDRVAQEFLKHFLVAFAGGRSLYPSVREARERLQALEPEFPCASWLPVICQNPAEVPPTWEDWCGKRRVWLRRPSRQELRTVGVSSLAIAGVIMGVRWLGGWQSLELAAFDTLMRLRPLESRDERLLVVTVTEQDIQAQGTDARRSSLSDRTLKQLLSVLERHQPAAIGLDIYRDFPANEPGLAQQMQQSDRLIAVCKRALSPANPTDILPPPEVPTAQLGFSNFVADQDGVVRRHLMILSPNTTSRCTTPYAFSVQLAARYLEQQGITAQFTPDKDLQFGNTVLKRLLGRTGGYQAIDTGGSQLLLNYRNLQTGQGLFNTSPREIARQVTLQEMLTGQVNPSAINNRVVLIGVTAPGSGDYWSTPYGRGLSAQIPGVMLQAQMVSQILSAVFDQRPLLWVWSQLGESLWILGWSFTGGILGWYFRRLTLLGLSVSITIAVLGGICLLLLIRGGWVPLVPSTLTLVTTSSTVAYALRWRKIDD
ncbi:CHASE2 domain-containing protein [Pantanalinema rosaneae CENA516]|uniref:CHASE2 domain-containing protein n=1 Tax=Pantanalinema rosaneae TaxID=1620701 RepID=UPI003D6FD03D